MITGFPPISDLNTALAKLKKTAFRPGTTSNHMSQFRKYLSFCIHYNLKDVDPSIKTICLYATHLSQTLESPASVLNYISGVRLMHKHIEVNATALDSFELTLTLRSIMLNVRHIPNARKPITIPLLKQLVHLCDTLERPLGSTVKAGIIIAFYGFLRQSNLVAHSAATFDPSRSPCRGHVKLAPPGLQVTIVWSKTQQSAMDQQAVIPIPKIDNVLLDPVRAYKEMIKDIPTVKPTDPLLMLKNRTPMLIKHLQAIFKEMLQALNLDTRRYSLHSLRRGGCATAYKSNVSELALQRHGLWKSTAFKLYATAPDPANSTIASALAKSSI